MILKRVYLLTFLDHEILKDKVADLEKELAALEAEPVKFIFTLL